MHFESEAVEAFSTTVLVITHTIRMRHLTGHGSTAFFAEVRNNIKESIMNNRFASRLRPFGSVGFTFLLSMACLVSAQAPSAARRDQTAVQTVTQALNAMGGLAAWSQVTDATVKGQFQSPASSDTHERVTWKSRGMSIRYEYSSPDGKSVAVVDQGKGHRQDSTGNVTEMDHRVSLTLFPAHLPGVALLSLLNSPDRSLSVVPATGSESNTIHVRSEKQMAKPGFSRITRQDWYFDLTTGLPIRVEFYLPDLKNQRFDGTATVTYTRWQTASSIQIPQTMQILYDGVLQSTVSLGAPSFNQGLSVSDFQLQ